MASTIETKNATLLLNKSDVQSLVTLREMIPAMEEVFRLYGKKQILGTGLIHIDAIGGEFHIKAGGIGGEHPCVAIKMAGAFRHNMENFGLPTLQGTIVLCDAKNGYPLAAMDASVITGLRTAATTAVAAKFLARKDSRTATIFGGAGRQGQLHAEALRDVLPLERIHVIGRDGQANVTNALRESDVIVTCTPAKAPLFDADEVRAGTFIAAVGADSPTKQEIDPHLFAKSTIVVDILEQCARVGDLHHALDAGVITEENVYATLGEIVAGKPARRSADEIILYDSTGTGLQDVGAATLVYERAIATGRGQVFNLFA